MWYLLISLMVADPAVPARYEFADGTTEFKIPGFMKEEDCKQAAKDMTGPLERAGYKVKTECGK